MICLVASDIHGSRKALASILSWLAKLKADTLIITGDICLQDNESLEMLRTCAASVTAVMGNCDTPETFLALGLQPVFTRRLNCAGRTILMSHGHKPIHPARSGLTAGDVCISGHTHTPHLYCDADGIIMLNPGSAGRPRNSAASCSLIEPDGITVFSLNSGKHITSMKFSPHTSKVDNCS